MVVVFVLLSLSVITTRYRRSDSNGPLVFAYGALLTKYRRSDSNGHFARSKRAASAVGLRRQNSDLGQWPGDKECGDGLLYPLSYRCAEALRARLELATCSPHFIRRCSIQGSNLEPPASEAGAHPLGLWSGADSGNCTRIIGLEDRDLALRRCPQNNWWPLRSDQRTPALWVRRLRLPSSLHA